ncbi:UNVERIFIED_CONTAM: hypothetical protein FKN15_037346 [Acipenser sinensis]
MQTADKSKKATLISMEDRVQSYEKGTLHADGGILFCSVCNVSLDHVRKGEPAVTRENNCLNAAKACNLNDTCKKYRSAYISPCTSRVSIAEVCNKRKCHKALRQFFDKVPPKHSYGMLFCSCPLVDQLACTERRRQTIVPVCSYEDKEKPNCLSLQVSCKTNYICRSRLADFFSSCQPEPRSLSGCLKENYADCLLAYSGLIGTVMTPNYLKSSSISVSPWCDCSASGNNKEECDKFVNFFKDNACLRHSIQAFGNGTDVNVWQPRPPVHSTASTSTPSHKARERAQSPVDEQTHINEISTAEEANLYPICANLQAQKMKSNVTVEETALCEDIMAELQQHSNNNHFPILFSFSVFSRPSSLPVGSGYEVLIQKFLCLYGDQIDIHRKFVIQLFSEEWGQYIDLPKSFAVAEKCKLRLVPLQMTMTTLGNLTPATTVFFCCDMQERFRPAIKYFGDIISVGQRLDIMAELQQHSNNNHFPILFSFSVFSRPSSLPVGSGYEVLIQKFLCLYGDQIDIHRKFVIQLFSEEWGQYIDLPKSFAVAEKCKLRLVPLQMTMTTLGNLTPATTVFFCCDMQERFRPAIKYFGDIISVGQRLLQGARILGIPVIVSEQYPKGLGSTVQELDLTGRLARTGIIVTTSESILLQLVSDKDHPKFKEIQNIIKASAPESGLLSKV